MIFLNPKILWFLFAIPVIGLTLYLWRIHKEKTLSSVIHKKFWKTLIPTSNPGRFFIKTGFYLAGLSFLILTLARPISGFETVETKQKGVDLFILLDTSASMDAQDVKPSRLEQAKREITDLLSLVEGDRLGLIPFSGKAFLFCPLTNDYTSFKTFVDEVDSTLIPVPGSNLEEAIRVALKSFSKDDTHAKSILVITDGGETEGEVGVALDAAKKQNVRVDFLGVGDKITGAPVPDHGGGYKKDENGKLLISKLDEATLQLLAQKSGGLYQKSVSSDSDFKTIYYSGIKAHLKESEMKSGQHKVPYEKFQIPLGMALVFISIEFFLSNRKSPAAGTPLNKGG